MMPSRVKLFRLPKGQQWNPREPWRHGEKRGDLNERGRWVLAAGRFQLGLSWMYHGDHYGCVGADSWRVYLTFARDPKGDA